MRSSMSLWVAWKRPAVAAIALLVAGALVIGCGSDSVSTPVEPPPPPVLYEVERTTVEVLEGECPDEPGAFVGRFDEDGGVVHLRGEYRWADGTSASGFDWTGTIDGAGNFAVENVAHPFTGGFAFEYWSAEGSFNADRSAVTATEEFRGTLTDESFCHGIIAWSGARQ